MSRGWGPDKPMSRDDKEKIKEMYYILRGFKRWLWDESNRVTDKGDAYYCIEEKLEKSLENLILMCGYALAEEPLDEEEEEDG